ncbi:MAG TPA: membrane dipeptidase [Blastocatellia bacterium]|nr:membrane dipeptidase [Blastocatellia bacterium]
MPIDSWSNISRRDFAVSVAGLALGPISYSTRTLKAEPAEKAAPVGEQSSVKAETTDVYDRAIVIDCLATPASFNVPYPPLGPLSAEQLDNVAKSGLTAVNVTISGNGRSFEDAIRNIALWQNEASVHSGQFLLVRGGGDITLAKKERKLGLILGFQDGEMIGRDLSLLDVFHKLGVRVIQPTYNVRNLIGDGCLEVGDAGLSSFGRQVVHRMNELGIALDLSHCGRRTTADGIAASAGPVIISHSGCAAVHKNPRNKEDRELKALAERGGVFGIYLMPYLGNDGSPYPTKEMFLAHLRHALDVCGTNHVGIGSDQSITPVVETAEYLKAWKEGGESRKRLGYEAPDEAGRFPYMAAINTPRRLEVIASEMGKMGYPASAVEKVIGENFLRVFQEIWKT